MLCNLDGHRVKTVWHKDFFEVSKAKLSQKEYQDMIDELNLIVDNTLIARQNNQK